MSHSIENPPTTPTTDSKGPALQAPSELPWNWPAEEMLAWLKFKHPLVLDRINRLCVVDDQYCLSKVHRVVPAENYKKMGYAGQGDPIRIYRGVPSNKEICPGDWVSLKADYAQLHSRSGDLKELSNVSPDDVFWSETDENEFFYLPRAWVKDASSAQDYLFQLSSEQKRILVEGEQRSISQHRDAIDRLAQYVFGSFDVDACGEFHGPDHWARVSAHGQAVSRSLGIDPLVSHVFALVHDFKREDEGADPGHGPRAADFIRDNREGLLSFLSDDQVSKLIFACELHSEGMTDSDPFVQSCWDADRLDLWRVDIQPNPRFMSSEYAKSNDSIKKARTLIAQNPWTESLNWAPKSRSRVENQSL